MNFLLHKLLSDNNKMNEDATHKLYKKNFETVFSVYYNDIINVTEQEIERIIFFTLKKGFRF